MQTFQQHVDRVIPTPEKRPVFRRCGQIEKDLGDVLLDLFVGRIRDLGEGVEEATQVLGMMTGFAVMGGLS